MDFLCHVLSFPNLRGDRFARNRFSYMFISSERALLAVRTIPHFAGTQDWKKLTNRLLQVVPGLRELLAFPLDLFLLEVHSPVVQLVLRVPEVQVIQEPLEVPGPLSFHSGPVTTRTCSAVSQFSISLPQGSSSTNMGTSEAVWESLDLQMHQEKLPTVSTFGGVGFTLLRESVNDWWVCVCVFSHVHMCMYVSVSSDLLTKFPKLSHLRSFVLNKSN